MNHWLSVVVFWPFAGALVSGLLPRRDRALAEGVGLVFAWAQWLLVLPVMVGFDPAQPGIQHEVDLPWIPSLGIAYHVGIDGFSLAFVLLTIVVWPFALLAGSRSVRDRGVEFVSAMLLLQATALGCFVALDVMLFAAFWHVLLLPLALLIGVWGGAARVRAATRFLMFALVASAGLLLALVFVAVCHYDASGGHWTFDLLALQRVVMPQAAQAWCFGAMVAAAGVMMPMFPMHVWLPDAHAESSTAGSMVLGTVLIPLGAHVLLRFAIPLCPLAALDGVQWLATVAVVGSVLGPALAWVQRSPNRALAYGSLGPAGLVALGILGWTQEGLSGAVSLGVALGVILPALFLAVGMFKKRSGTGGSPPWLSGLFLLTVLAGCGLPGLAAFVGEFSVLIGTFGDAGRFVHDAPVLALVAAGGTVFQAASLLRVYQGAVSGSSTALDPSVMRDLSPREAATLVPLVLLIIGLGVYPRPLLRRLDATASAAVEALQLRQCAALLHGTPTTGTDGTKPVMLSEMREFCGSPEEVLSRVLHDERLRISQEVP